MTVWQLVEQLIWIIEVYITILKTAVLWQIVDVYKRQEEIVRKRDELLDESSEIYCAAPLTDGKSYAAAQAALKTNEEQFLSLIHI